MEIAVNNVAATAGNFALGIAATAGTQSSSSALIPLGSAATAQGTCAITWSGSPTQPTTFLRKHQFAATQGATIIWSWPYGLSLAAGTELVLWNLATNGVVNVTVTVEE